MTHKAVDHLLEFARQVNADVSDKWGSTTVEAESPIDHHLLEEAVAIEGLGVFGLFGDLRYRLPLDREAADTNELAPIRELAPNERIAAELAGMPSIEIAQTLPQELVAVEVIFRRSGWIRTRQAFFDEVSRDWLTVARGLQTTIEIEGQTIRMVRATEHSRADRPEILVPTSEGAIDEGVLLVLHELSDAVAWTYLGEPLNKKGSAVEIGLLPGEPANRPVTPATSRGGLDLLSWLTATDDANRNEAFQHVLSVVSATSRASLPDAKALKRLAERQRIALSRDRAAEVQRAIAEGQRAASDVVRQASADFGKIVEEATTTANAAVVAVLGLVIFLARGVDLLPRWIVFLAATVVVCGVGLVTWSRLSRIGDYQGMVKNLIIELEDNPLFPEEERRKTIEGVESFDIGKRAFRARSLVMGLGIATAGIALSATFWLVENPTAYPVSPEATPSSPEIEAKDDQVSLPAVQL